MATLEESLAETVSVAPAPSAYLPAEYLTDAVSVAPAVLGPVSFPVLLAESLDVDAALVGLTPAARITEALSILSESVASNRFSRTQTMRVAVGDTPAPNFTYGLRLSELVRAVERYTAVPRFGAAIAEDVTLGFATVATYALRVFERVETEDTPAPSAVFGLLLADATRIVDKITTGETATLSEQITLSYAVDTVYALSVIEQLGISEALLGPASYSRSIADTIRVVDVFRRFVSGEITEPLTLSEALTSIARRPADVDENLSLTDTAASSMVIRVALADGVDITAAETLRMTYDGQLADGVEFVSAFLSAGDSFTTWAMNTRTTAVTEYQNYVFNSFAQLGGRYLGASSNGLYELTGDDDAGTQIIASLKTGIAQLGGSRYTSFKAAYLGVRGGGDYVLKLETGDGKSYTYSVTANDMETTKINLGKGLRARYFSFELISSGQDFDLDTLEFVPIVAQRRV